MVERKVLNKYYPPDFDPEKLRDKGKNARLGALLRKGAPRSMDVRMMFPFTMQCGGCGEFNYIATKFNARVERIKTEDYLGIPIWRFYGKCPHCRHMFVFRTDPKNTDYTLESGGTRTYDPFRDTRLAEDAAKEQAAEELEDTIKALEDKTSSTALEMQSLEVLDSLRQLNKRLLRRDMTLADAYAFIEKTVELEGEVLCADGLLPKDQRDVDAMKEVFAKRHMEALEVVEEGPPPPLPRVNALPAPTETLPAPTETLPAPTETLPAPSGPRLLKGYSSSDEERPKKRRRVFIKPKR